MLDQIKHNTRVHDLIAPLYEARHGEIFNQTEQQRINGLVAFAINSIHTGSKVIRVLDFGAGTGNLTRHLLNNTGGSVVASDISVGCLREIKRSVNDQERLELSQLNGYDLSQFADESFDMVATYSVLHHVPDYLAIVTEFVRTVKPGGIIYIDHEVCPSYWDNIPEYQMYCHELAKSQSELPKTFVQKLLHLICHKNRWRYVSSLFLVKWAKVADEGDIHVHEDDHIEWSEIRTCLSSECEIVSEQDYLVCRERTLPAPVWEKWHDVIVDMRLIVARKTKKDT